MITQNIDIDPTSRLVCTVFSGAYLYLGYENGTIYRIKICDKPKYVDSVKITIEFNSVEINVKPFYMKCIGDDIWVSGLPLRPDFTGNPTDDTLEAELYREFISKIPCGSLFKLTVRNGVFEIEGKRDDCSGFYHHGDHIYSCFNKRAGFYILDSGLNVSALCEVPIDIEKNYNNEMIVVGNILYLLQRHNSIDIFDVTDAACPCYVRSITSDHWSVKCISSSPIKRVLHYNNYLIITEKTCPAVVVDISIPEKPQLFAEDGWPYRKDIRSNFSCVDHVDGDYLLYVNSYGLRWEKLIYGKDSEIIAKFNLYEFENIVDTQLLGDILCARYFNYNGCGEGVVFIDVKDIFMPKILYIIYVGERLRALPDPEMYSSLEAALREPDKVKKLDLSRLMLTEIPEEVFLMKNIGYLNLGHNRIKKVHERISELNKLKEINLYCNKVLESLPDSIVNLTALEELVLDNNNLKKLPDGLKKMADHKKITWKNNPCQ